METRKVQRLGPSTLAMTLPASWVKEQSVKKGDEVTLRTGGKGTLTVLPESAKEEDTTVTIWADNLNEEGLERAIVAQYVLGRRVITVARNEGTLRSTQINAVYEAETQLMGLGVIEETPDQIAIRCSVDPEDFTLDNLLERLESTGSTMRTEAIDALAAGDPDLARRALNRERQANKIFVLLLRLIFTSFRTPTLAEEIGLESTFPLIGYRSVAKNLELTADNAEDIATIVIDNTDEPLAVAPETLDAIEEFSEAVDELTATAVRSVVERDYDLTIVCRSLYQQIIDREFEILTDLPPMENRPLLQVREVLVSLAHTAQYAMRNVEIASNLALSVPSSYVTLD
ncbi:UNVERIFIED_CONTAM: histidine kinase [Euhalothece sp. KZN 001]